MHKEWLFSCNYFLVCLNTCFADFTIVSKAYGDSTKERKRAQIAQGWPFLLYLLKEHFLQLLWG